jgi:protein-tyrosine phosphatase
MIQNQFDPTTITELPYGLPGRVFRSPMPFQQGDEKGHLLKQYRAENINCVVLLTPRHEYLSKTGMDLVKVYTEAGFRCMELPISDFSVPDLEALDQSIGEVLSSALNGSNIVVHCYAGFGRTGTFLACLAIRVFGFQGKQAMGWVRKYVPPAMENEEQIRFVLDYGKRHANNQR